MNLNMNDDKYFEPVTKKQRISHYKKPHDPMDSFRYDNRDPSSFMMNPRLRDNDDYFGYVLTLFIFIFYFVCHARVTKLLLIKKNLLFLSFFTNNLAQIQIHWMITIVA